MATIKRFEDLEIWQNARGLCKEIYNYVNSGRWKNDFRFSQQITAAAGSIMDNIAEGFARGGNKEFVLFLSIAKGSVAEMMSQIYRAVDVGYLTKEEGKLLYMKLKDESTKIQNLITSLKKSTIPGIRYRTETNNC